jgi:isocitrate dehydrogenase (NAD+)
MKKHTISIIKGDGIGPDIMDSTLKVLDTLFPDKRFTYEFVLAGEEALLKENSLLPQNTLDSISRNKLALKSPLMTPKGIGFKSINVTLRQTFKLYANVRPIISFQDTGSRFENIDLITVRENTEGMYSGEGQTLSEDGEIAESKSIITKQGSLKIANYAFNLARKLNRKKVTIVHKSNILKTTSGLFLKTALEKSLEFPEINTEEMIVDACAMNLVKNPHKFDVLVTTNLFGDILSDLCAGLVGGLGLAPGANIGDDIAIFEAVHGTAPDIVGKDLANPSSLMLSACMMLDYLGYVEESTKWRKSIQMAITNKNVCTKDLGGQGGTKSFTNFICETVQNL